MDLAPLSQFLTRCRPTTAVILVSLCSKESSGQDYNKYNSSTPKVVPISGVFSARYPTVINVPRTRAKIQKSRLSLEAWKIFLL